MTDRSHNEVKARTLSDMIRPLGDRVDVCDKHGEFTATGTRLGKREIWTNCPDCKEARLAAERQAEAQALAERALAHMERLLGEAAIPKRFLARSLDNFHASTPEQLAALKVAREFAENFEVHSERGTSLILSGLPGTGKSHLATAILQAILPGHCGLYTTASNVIRAVRGTWRKDSDRSESQVINAYSDTSLLVMDEIGMGYESDGERVILFDVLDRRYREQRPTILLTNLDRAGFKAFIGERVYDRLSETARWVAFDWESFRSKARNEFGTTSSSSEPNFTRDDHV